MKKLFLMLSLMSSFSAFAEVRECKLIVSKKFLGINIKRASHSFYVDDYQGVRRVSVAKLFSFRSNEGRMPIVNEFSYTGDIQCLTGRECYATGTLMYYGVYATDKRYSPTTHYGLEESDVYMWSKDSIYLSTSNSTPAPLRKGYELKLKCSTLK